MARRRKGEDASGFYDPDEAPAVENEEAIEDTTASEQPQLIPMSDDELRKAGKKLAKLVKDLVEMKVEHKELREEQAADRKKIEAQIEATAGSIRQQGR